MFFWKKSCHKILSRENFTSGHSFITFLDINLQNSNMVLILRAVFSVLSNMTKFGLLIILRYLLNNTKYMKYIYIYVCMFIRTRYLIKKHKNQLMFCKLQQATLNFFHIIFFNNLYSKKFIYERAYFWNIDWGL